VPLQACNRIALPYYLLRTSLDDVTIQDDTSRGYFININVNESNTRNDHFNIFLFMV
jgi:hypothetical protein